MMRRARCSALAAMALILTVQSRVEAVSCEAVSADFVSALISSARACLTRLAPFGRSCNSRNRLPNLRATRVANLCPSGTVERLECTARPAIIAAGLAYDSLSATGFSHICTTASCGNAIVESGEQCDDGNVTNGDGCSAICQFEGGACTDVCAGIVPVSGTSIQPQLIAGGLNSPLFVTAPPRDVTRLFILEQGGTIRIVKFGALLPTPFLDISARLTSGGERGLLGLAFHPDYANNGRFFVDYTDLNGDTVVSEFHVSGNPDLADATSEAFVLQQTQPFANHNGGDIAFGPDGYLYIALGDGGSGGDPDGNGQNTNTLLGKLLRLDINTPPYVSPPTNPFFGATPGRDEIWAYGVRNPWRFSFDRLNGDLYIGDVGQDSWEELDYQPAVSSGGQNYGWNTMEGNHCYSPSSGCDQTGLTLPIQEYGHGSGCSITGGYTYRGCKMPDLAGTYFYADFCSAFIKTFKVVGGVATNLQDRTGDLPGINAISSFGEDARGEIYITDISAGKVFKIVPGP